MEFDWITFAFQAVNVLILLAILRRFLFRPVAAIIEARRAEAAALIAEAEASREAAAEAARTAQAEEAKTAAARAAALDAARAEAEALKAAILKEAQAEAARRLSAAAAQAEDARRAAQAEDEGRIRALALAALSRTLSAQPADRAVAGYAARLAGALGEIPADRRAALFRGASLIAPRPLSAAERAEADAALAPFGLSALPFAVDPALIAGLELRGPDGALRNSVAHDLSRIAEALAQEDRADA